MRPMCNIALRAAREAGDMIVKAADNIDGVNNEHEDLYKLHSETDVSRHSLEGGAGNGFIFGGGPTLTSEHRNIHCSAVK